MTFDPVVHAVNGQRLLQPNGDLPNFHDASVCRIHFERGDIRPEDDVWIMPWILMDLEMRAEEHARRIVMKFSDCSDISMTYFNHDNPIDDLEFNLEARGFFADGRTPLPPFIKVNFTPNYGLALAFKCFEIEVRDHWTLT